MDTKNRRTFLKIAVLAISAFFVFLWNKLTQNHIKVIGQTERILPFNKSKTISFSDNYIVVNLEGNTTVFSAHCSHLGCKINNAENGKLVCPCHGSEYDLQGNVLKGPAYKNLEIVPSKISEDGKNIEIEG